MNTQTHFVAVPAGCGLKLFIEPQRALVTGTAEQTAQAASVRRSGLRVGEVLQGATRGDGESVDFRVALDTSHCYWFGGASNEKIGLYLFDPKGKRVESQGGTPNDVLMEYCPSSDGIHRLESKLRRGGEFAVAVYAGSKPEPVAMVAVVPKEAGPAIEDLIAKEAAAAAPEAKQQGTFFEGSVDETTWSTALQAGKCYWFVAAGQTGKVKKLALYIWDPKNSRITATKAESNVVTAGHCAKETGMFRFQAKGKYHVMVCRGTACHVKGSGRALDMVTKALKIQLPAGILAGWLN